MSEQKQNIGDVQVTLTRDELRTLISEGVTDAFHRMGIQAHEPTEMQRDFAHLRRWRMAVDDAQKTGFRIVVGTLIAGLLGAVWMGIKVYLGR